MSKHFCPHCDGQAEVCEVSVGLADDRELQGWAWCCAKCGAQGPVLSTELESLDNLLTYSLAKTMLPSARARMEEVLDGSIKAPAMLPLALREMEGVLLEGARTHPPNDWRELGGLGNMDHAQQHLEEFEQYQQTDDLAHAFVRLGMALQLRLEKEADTED